MTTFTQNNTKAPTREVSFGQREYGEVWLTLLEAIGEGRYFNGKVTTSHAGFDSVLTATLIIYRDLHAPEQPISGIVPIWWEMATYEGEVEVLNDFSFRELLIHKGV